jgi:hypothetical protein
MSIAMARACGHSKSAASASTPQPQPTSRISAALIALARVLPQPLACLAGRLVVCQLVEKQQTQPRRGMTAGSKRAPRIEVQRDLPGKGLMVGGFPAWHDRNPTNPPGRKVLLPDIAPLGVVPLALLDHHARPVGHQLMNGVSRLIGTAGTWLSSRYR